jgi:hypothetical protein
MSAAHPIPALQQPGGVLFVCPLAEAEANPTEYRQTVALALLTGWRVVTVYGMKEPSGKDRAAELWREGVSAFDRLEHGQDPGRRLGEFTIDQGVVREHELWPTESKHRSGSPVEPDNAPEA